MSLKGETEATSHGLPSISAISWWPSTFDTDVAQKTFTSIAPRPRDGTVPGAHTWDIRVGRPSLAALGP